MSYCFSCAAHHRARGRSRGARARSRKPLDTRSLGPAAHTVSRRSGEHRAARLVAESPRGRWRLGHLHPRRPPVARPGTPRWGQDRADVIWDASTVRVVLGGLGDADDLTRISRLAGEIDEAIDSTSRGSGGTTCRRPTEPGTSSNRSAGQRRTRRTPHLKY